MTHATPRMDRYERLTAKRQHKAPLVNTAQYRIQNADAAVSPPPGSRLAGAVECTTSHDRRATFLFASSGLTCWWVAPLPWRRPLPTEPDPRLPHRAPAIVSAAHRGPIAGHPAQSTTAVAAAHQGAPAAASLAARWGRCGCHQPLVASCPHASTSGTLRSRSVSALSARSALRRSTSPAPRQAETRRQAQPVPTRVR